MDDRQQIIDIDLAIAASWSMSAGQSAGGAGHCPPFMNYREQSSTLTVPL